MQINVTTDFDKAYQLLNRLSGPQARDAMAKALTDAAFEARKVVQSNMGTSFDRVTPYIKNSIRVVPATSDKLTARVEPKYMGGKGVDPEEVLRAEVFGGQRRKKRSEAAMERAGILPGGFSMVPGGACPLDQYGNIKGAFIVQLISYFQAFGQQGYSANMTDKRKAKLAGVATTAKGYKSINGVVYFVSYGKLRSGRGGSHLHPGIWSKTGIHGVDVKPIIMFVKQASYTKRLDFFDAPVRAALDKFNPRLRYQLRKIIESNP